MTLDEIKDGDFFVFDGHVFKATEKAQGYKRICVLIYDGSSYAIERYVEVEKVI